MQLKRQEGKQDTMTKKDNIAVVSDKKAINNLELAAKKFNNIFTDIGPKLAIEIERVTKLLCFTKKSWLFTIGISFEYPFDALVTRKSV